MPLQPSTIAAAGTAAGSLFRPFEERLGTEIANSAFGDAGDQASEYYRKAFPGVDPMTLAGGGAAGVGSSAMVNPQKSNEQALAKRGQDVQLKTAQIQADAAKTVAEINQSGPLASSAAKEHDAGSVLKNAQAEVQKIEKSSVDEDVKRKQYENVINELRAKLPKWVLIKELSIPTAWQQLDSSAIQLVIEEAMKKVEKSPVNKGIPKRRSIEAPPEKPYYEPHRTY